MFSTFISHLVPEENRAPREGDLYRVVNIHGRNFALYYGYYAECDRINPLAAPMPIYPDFIEDPQYTDEGFAFVTMMQDACSHFDGSKDPDSDCSGCGYFCRCEELFGICTCRANKKPLSANEIKRYQ